MNVLVFSSFYLPGYKGGGPIKTIANLVSATSDNGMCYYIITKNRDLGDKEPYPNISSNDWSGCGEAEVFYCSPGITGLMRGWLKIFHHKYDVVYLNSFFSPFFSFVPLVFSLFKGKRVVLGPRGEFSSGALNIKSRKKWAFLRFFKLLSFHRNVVFQASSEYEAEDIRRVLGDGVDVFVAEDIGSLQLSAGIPKEKDACCLRLVFISRISPKKNLLYALQVLRQAKCSLVYDVYGPVEDEKYWGECEAVIASLPNNVSVNYCGELQPKDVVGLLSQYDLFFMPTHGENYGHVIAEALCAGLPILISDQTPWRDLEEQGIGWDLSLDELTVFSRAIEKAHAMSADEYAAFRERVLAWAKQKFENPKAIEANKAMFEYAFKK
ncbi:glycosyltransferase family 4 protein [Halomonas tibetensis]|uniref:Glycosyltransferase family 4 protein n=1 Tax=Halomonas tibetensis TaxID=2259590 RepID=A0ABV7BBK0_9GAMM